jgi:hypothetical protein
MPHLRSLLECLVLGVINVIVWALFIWALYGLSG